jgi:dephospho-CoA kinase
VTIGVLRSRALGVRAEFRVPGVVQEGTADGEFELARAYARFDRGVVTSGQDQHQADRRLEGVLKIVIAQVDRAVISVASREQILDVGEDAAKPLQLNTRVHLRELALHESQHGGGVLGICGGEHQVGRELETRGAAPIKNLPKCRASPKLPRSRFMIVGLTGGMGCGKSTASRLLEQRGFRRLDSDELVRDRVLRDPEVIAALRGRFGDGVVGTDGVIDRARLSAAVFERPDQLRWLEELTHPAVFSLWRAAFAADPSASWVVEVPLLFEKQLENWFDFTVCVACSPALQLVRLERRGVPRDLAGQRISKQLPLARKIELSDIVLWNDGSTEFLQAEIDSLAAALESA